MLERIDLCYNSTLEHKVKERRRRGLPAVSVVVPAYNEAQTIAGVLEHIVEVMRGLSEPFQVIVVDDGSTDGTAQAFEESEHLRLIRHPQNRGYGAALKTGIRASKSELVVIIDADGTYPPEAIPKLLAEADSQDMVVGARTGANVAVPLLRRPAKRALTWLASYLAEADIPDLNSGLRVLRTESVLPLFHILPAKFSFTTTITLAMMCDSDYLVKFVPIDYHRREGSKSKIRPIRDTLYFIQLILRTVMYFNPLKVLAPISMGLFLLAGIVFLYSTLVLGKLLDVTVMIIVLAAMQVMVMALVADMIHKMTKPPGRPFA